MTKQRNKKILIIRNLVRNMHKYVKFHSKKKKSYKNTLPLTYY